MFKVYANYGYRDENELFASPSMTKATDWAMHYVYNGGDLAGCTLIEVAYHSPDGEYHVVKRYDVDEEDAYA